MLDAIGSKFPCICQQLFCPPHAFPVFAVGYEVDVFCQYLVEHGNGLVVPAVELQGTAVVVDHKHVVFLVIDGMCPFRAFHA